MRAYAWAAMLVTVVAVLGWTHWTAYTSGRDAVLARLQSDRVQVLVDGKEIDNEVLSADDDGLCALLGGCVQSDGAGG